MPNIPNVGHFDSSLAFLRDPYRFISTRCRELGTDLFHARLALQQCVCLTGSDAAQLFYDETRFKRRGVAPRRFQKTLFGMGGVQGLDGDEHRHRKQMFLSLMSEERVRAIGELSLCQWQSYADHWSGQSQVVLYPASCEVLTRVACSWAGVPLEDADVGQRARELRAMFDYAGTVGPKHWWARIARRRQERWISEIVEQCRAGKLNIPPESATYVISNHRNLKGELLPVPVSAVEILNVIRPIVAVAVYIVFAAHAIQQNPECRQKLASGPDQYPYLFTQEVRRFYPFFPAVGAEVRQDFEWRGYKFPKNTPVLLDLYGTNHDPRSFESPETFQPDRFRHWKENLFYFIPQGGGDHFRNHRCPGEWICIELIKAMATFFVQQLRYTVPDQDLVVDFDRVPALPKSQMILTHVHWQ